MKVITEIYLRSIFRSGAPDSIALDAGQVLTPAASQYLHEMRVPVTKQVLGVNGGTADRPLPSPQSAMGEHARLGRQPAGSIRAGATRKAEHTTQLHGHTLVVKDHPRIRVRGLLDHLQATILLLQKVSAQKTMLVADLGDVLSCSRNILKAEVLEIPLEKMHILGFDEADLRDRSHHPQRYFGIDHIIPDSSMDRIQLELNQLRTEVRKVELAAVTAFVHGSRVERPDLLQALNRMSSAVYVMMLKWQTGAYQ